MAAVYFVALSYPLAIREIMKPDTWPKQDTPRFDLEVDAARIVLLDIDKGKVFLAIDIAEIKSSPKGVCYEGSMELSSLLCLSKDRRMPFSVCVDLSNETLKPTRGVR